MSDGRRIGGLDRVVEAADRLLRAVLAVAFGVILAATLVQIIGRSVFGATIIGTDEVARYLMIATTFLAIPLLVRGRLMIAVDALAHYLPDGATQLWLQRAIYLVEAFFYLVFTNYAAIVLSNFLSTGQSSAELAIPLAWPVATMVAGTALGFVSSLLLLARTFIVPEQYASSERGGFPTLQEGDR